MTDSIPLPPAALATLATLVGAREQIEREIGAFLGGILAVSGHPAEALAGFSLERQRLFLKSTAAEAPDERALDHDSGLGQGAHGN